MHAACVAAERPGAEAGLADHRLGVISGCWRSRRCPPPPAALLIALSPRIAPMLAARLGGTNELVYQLVLLPPLLMEVAGPDARAPHRPARPLASRRAARVVEPPWRASAAAGRRLDRRRRDRRAGAALDGRRLRRSRSSSPAIMWLATTLGGVVAAQAPATASTDAPTLKSKLLELLAHLAPLVFILGLLVAVEHADHQAAGARPTRCRCRSRSACSRPSG